MSEEIDISVERSIEVEASPEAVWDHIVDGSLASEWMESPIAIEARPGGSIEFAPEDVDFIGTVEDVDPGRSITWSWRHPDRDPSQVTITLTPDGDGTLVTVTERLLPYRITDTREFGAGFEIGFLADAVLLAA